MVLINKKELKALDIKARKEKVKTLEMELIKSKVSANKSNAKTKELKRTIAKLLTMNNSAEVEKKK